MHIQLQTCFITNCIL